jgi:Fuc2NAc and GlcNAc transferase
VSKIFVVYFGVFALTFLGVEIFRRWSLQREILDIPNERSSHTVPTPRGGGLIIFLVSIVTFLVYTGLSGFGFYWSYFAGALIVAFISLTDDVRAISPVSRILFHGFASGLVVLSLGGFVEILIPFFGIVQLGVWGDILAFFWIVWLINAYNFMDGIDGIAAMQAVTAGIGWSLAGWFLGIEFLNFYGIVLALSAGGFLMLNWQPAKIFMGDVGSAFLGYSFAVLPLFAAKKIQGLEIGSVLPWMGVIFVWFFIFDSVFTLFRRLFRGEKIWKAHREHIYQKMVIAGASHSKVAGFYGLASAILVFVLIASLKYSFSVGKAVFAVIVFETGILLIIWSKAEAKSGRRGNLN